MPETDLYAWIADRDYLEGHIATFESFNHKKIFGLAFTPVR